MVIRGHVRNGKVVLDFPVTLPDGAAVDVEPVDHLSGEICQGPKEVGTQAETTEIVAAREGEGDGATSLYHHYHEVIGSAVGLPPDASINKYHYLYGRPKV